MFNKTWIKLPHLKYVYVVKHKPPRPDLVWHNSKLLRLLAIICEGAWVVNQAKKKKVASSALVHFERWFVAPVHGKPKLPESNEGRNMELSVSRRSCTSILPCRVRQCLLLAVKWKPLPKVEMSTENSLMRVRFCTTNANVPLHSGILPIWGDSRIQVQAALRIVLAYIKLYASSQAQIALRLARAWRSCIGKHFHPSTAWWEITLQELLFIFWIVRNQEQRIVPFRDLIEAVKRVFLIFCLRFFCSSVSSCAWWETRIKEWSYLEI